MPRERVDFTTDEDGNEKHPAFGMIGVHRISANPGEVLFQSDLRHHEYIRLEVHEATRNRDLVHDWVHPGNLVCEVSMSMSQFASFVSSGGTTGVPCTIAFTGSGRGEPGHRPGLNPAPRLAVSHEEVRAAANKAYGRIQDAFEAYAKVLADKSSGAAARRNALNGLAHTIANASGNVAYAAKTLDEHAENVVEKSRADIEAMSVRTAERLGIPLSLAFQHDELTAGSLEAQEDSQDFS
jgi:hypothetical protein